MVRFFYFSVALACLCCLACGVAQNLTNMQAQTSQAIETFHKQLGAGDADGILASGTPEFRASLPDDTMRGMFSRIRKKMGACSGWKSTSYRVNTNTHGTTMNLSGTTHCENGDLQETFLWVMVNGHALLHKYSANSPQLMVD